VHIYILREAGLMKPKEVLKVEDTIMKLQEGLKAW